MGQHRITDDITNRIDVGHVGTHVLIDGDKSTFIHIDTCMLSADQFAIRDAPHRHQHLVVGLRFIRRMLAFEKDFQTTLLRFDLGYLRLEHDGLNLIFHPLLQRTYQIRITTGNQA